MRAEETPVLYKGYGANIYKSALRVLKREVGNTAQTFLLVLNSGSSSLKYSLFEEKSLREVLQGHVDGIGLDRCCLKVKRDNQWTETKFLAEDHLHAVIKAFQSLKDNDILQGFDQIQKVGHRVVHGGEKFTQPTRITPAVLKKIKSLSVLAPLHNPPALAGILAVKKILPKVPQIAVFDTAFHHSIPKEAFLYGLPYQLYEELGIRKYGFHGISHEYVSRLARKALNKQRSEQEEIITCHLGNGSSITAVKNGRSVDTSMGFTPLDGLIMGTRSGEMDPEIILFLLNQKHYTTAQLEKILQKQSGLKGLAGSSDVRELHDRALKKDKQAILALDMLAYRIAKFIGAYAAALKGLDAIVFTAGIGENAYYLRKKACSYLGFLGVKLDAHANRKNLTYISKPSSKVKVLVLHTDEARAIAEQL
ncbi:acetate kinase [Candidatus Woesearchaeota archaeon]|nr:acetate kinase [Candidatus Woesearchaeota archaeon]